MRCMVSGGLSIIARVGADDVFVWRAITVEDCSEWARLLNAIEESNGTQELVGAEDLEDDTMMQVPNASTEYRRHSLLG